MEIRREILLIIMLLVVIAVLVKIVEFFQVTSVEADASKFVKEDLHSKYPTADIEIMSMVPKENYLEVKTKMTLGLESPCPERRHIFYNYPAQNFVPQPDEIITSNCAVCTAGLCTIAFPEEAIIASHTFPGTSDIKVYIFDNPNAIPIVKEMSDSWIVTWNSQTADYYYTISIHRNGTILSLDSISKS